MITVPSNVNMYHTKALTHGPPQGASCPCCNSAQVIP